MNIPSIHEFQLREVVNYEQLNSNFSNVVNYMLKYEQGTVSSYDDTTKSAQVVIDGGTVLTVYNYTPFDLSASDTVYIYYWTDIEVDGYIGFKVFAPL